MNILNYLTKENQTKLLDMVRADFTDARLHRDTDTAEKKRANDEALKDNRAFNTTFEKRAVEHAGELDKKIDQANRLREAQLTELKHHTKLLCDLLNLRKAKKAKE